MPKYKGCFCIRRFTKKMVVSRHKVVPNKRASLSTDRPTRWMAKGETHTVPKPGSIGQITDRPGGSRTKGTENQLRRSVTDRPDGWLKEKEYRKPIPLVKSPTRPHGLTHLKPQSRLGTNPLKFEAVCPQNGTAVLTGFMRRYTENRG